MIWGPDGSVRYELASGIPAVRADSDLDFILFAPKNSSLQKHSISGAWSAVLKERSMH